MKRNSTTLFIESINAITPIPWNNNSPDFSGFSEPTLSILINAYEENKNNIEIIPDPEPTPQIENPNWGYFGGAIIESPLYEKYKSNPDFQMLGIMITVFTSNGGDAQMYPAFMLIWNKFNESSEGLLNEEITQINELMTAFNIPFIVNTNGEITQL